MCPECAAEYADPLDRRFHAQPDACFDCGPHITWREAAGGMVLESSEATPAVGDTRESSDAIIERCVELLEAGGIVAIKGPGGFHGLRRRQRASSSRAAPSQSAAATSRLPLWCATLPMPSACAVSTTPSATCWPAASAPSCCCAGVVLAGDSFDALALAPSVAHDLPELGVMLPYTPLQHLLLAAAETHGMHALVMTSGNLSEEPIETDDDLAWEHLVAAGIADALLGNDRAILSRYDDSVVRVVDRVVMPVRRARGYARSRCRCRHSPAPRPGARLRPAAKKGHDRTHARRREWNVGLFLCRSISAMSKTVRLSMRGMRHARDWKTFLT